MIGLVGVAPIVGGLFGTPIAVAAATINGGCSWLAQYGLGGSAVPESDTDAAYWLSSYLQFPGRGLVITGEFPNARYMSFALYSGGSLVHGGALFDAEIQPSSGVNPFQPGASGTGDYTLNVVSGPEPAEPAPNTLYTGTTAIADFELLYRIYDPSVLPAGGVPLPQLTDTFDGQPTTAHGPCVGLAPTGQLAGQVALPPSDPVSNVGAAEAAATATPEPAWTRATFASAYPNPDNSYLQAAISQSGGQLVVLQAQMPTFPNTNVGEPAWESGQQVRYWSICENDGPILSVIACVPDYEAVESDQIATFVISSASNRPPNATAADGVNWLPWGAFPAGLLIYRQMLAAPTFQGAIAATTGAGSLASVMGPYLPKIAYCSEATFAAVGATGCLAAATAQAG